MRHGFCKCSLHFLSFLFLLSLLFFILYPPYKETNERVKLFGFSFLPLSAVMKKEKYYVVWAGVSPGIYTSWTDCQLQTKGYEGAKYKSFESREEAEKAFASSPYAYIKRSLPLLPRLLPHRRSPPHRRRGKQPCRRRGLQRKPRCHGVPGSTRRQPSGNLSLRPMYGTNNIGEFLAIVHGLALLKQKGFDMPIYSDSVNAINWIKQKKCKTKLPRDAQDRRAFPPDRTCGEVVARKHLHHPHPKMGDKAMGGNSGRLRKEVKKREHPGFFIRLCPRQENDAAELMNE